jgi:hypothetical protein
MVRNGADRLHAVSPETPAGAPYDRGFKDAVDEGFLTVRQAIERGDRALYASTLAINGGQYDQALDALNRCPPELRTAINQIYQALGRTVPTYTDPTLVPGQTTARAAHIQELRNAVTALP